MATFQDVTKYMREREHSEVRQGPRVVRVAGVREGGKVSAAYQALLGFRTGKAFLT